jgi:hypothetical protein
MGEIADSIIEGEICQICCAPDDHGTRGFPFTCAECDGPEYFGEDDDDPSVFDKPKKVKCPFCPKMVSELGVDQHVAAKHSENE